MSRISRRILLSSSVILSLVGCSGKTPLTPAQIVADATAIITGLQGAMKQIAFTVPTLIPTTVASKIDAYLANAASAVTTLTASLPADKAASTIQTIDGYINAVLATIAAPPLSGLIPPPYNMAFAAAAILAPTLEAFVNQYIPTASVSPRIEHARAVLTDPVPGLTVDAARLVLQGYGHA